MKNQYLSVLPLLFVSFTLSAQQSVLEPEESPFLEQFGEYTVFYSAVRSDSLPDEMARRHGLPARADAVLLNIAVRREGMNVPARVEARATNLAQQVRMIDMNRSEANDYVSYLGVVDIADQEVLDFHVEIQPEGAAEAFTLEFRGEFLPMPRAASGRSGVQ
jgi:hypothetical protein